MCQLYPALLVDLIHSRASRVSRKTLSQLADTVLCLDATVVRAGRNIGVVCAHVLVGNLHENLGGLPAEAHEPATQVAQECRRRPWVDHRLIVADVCDRAQRLVLKLRRILRQPCSCSAGAHVMHVFGVLSCCDLHIPCYRVHACQAGMPMELATRCKFARQECR